MAQTEAQKRAKERYEAKVKKTYIIKLHKEIDADIIEKLEAVENRNGYLKELIRADINR